MGERTRGRRRLPTRPHISPEDRMLRGTLSHVVPLKFAGVLDGLASPSASSTHCSESAAANIALRARADFDSITLVRPTARASWHNSESANVSFPAPEARRTNGRAADNKHVLDSSTARSAAPSRPSSA